MRFSAALSRGFDIVFPRTVELYAGTLVVECASELVRCVLFGSSWGEGFTCIHVKPEKSTNAICLVCSCIVTCKIKLRCSGRVIFLKDAHFGPNVVTSAEVMRLLLFHHAVENYNQRAAEDQKERVVRLKRLRKPVLSWL
jgi:hypothetical protein